MKSVFQNTVSQTTVTTTQSHGERAAATGVDRWIAAEPSHLRSAPAREDPAP